ncbi:MAG: hypothetical protein WBD07_07570 [Vicinamibacterales bacterium]
MTSRRRFLLLVLFLFSLALSAVPFVAPARLAAASLPARLTDQEFWRLSSESSEADGSFRSDNLLSNESGFQFVVPDLMRIAKPGRVYMGVGPEQNFTYIVATRPAMAIIVDIRRGNLDLQLMYKALFELSADRAEFVSRLFAKRRPAGLTTRSTAREIFAAYWDVQTSDALYAENLRAITGLLRDKHGFALSSDDLKGIEDVYHAFYWFGPRLQYSSTGSFGGTNQPTYADLMTATDGQDVARGYLATEENFAFMKDLESRNMLVPVVGNFGGPKAIRAVGQFLKAKDATVSTFYLSNVEQYLRQDGIWVNFCASVATLPLDETSTFIRSVRRVGDNAPGFGLASELGNISSEVKDCR